MKAILIVACLLWADFVLAAAAPSVTCGATLANRQFTLTSDLVCSASQSPITLTKHAQLDLNGHTIFGPVVLDDERTELKNGFVDCTSLTLPCVTIQGTGKHLLQNIRVQRGDFFLILVTSSNNSLVWNTAFQGPEIGFVVEGNNNILTGNIALSSGQWAFSIVGDGNRITQNSSTGNHDRDFAVFGNDNVLVQNAGSGADAFFIQGDNNRVSRNVVFSSSDAFSIFGQNNIIENNLAPFQSVVDGNVNCDNNTWSGNIFATANQACIQ